MEARFTDGLALVGSSLLPPFLLRLLFFLDCSLSDTGSYPGMLPGLGGITRFCFRMFRSQGIGGFLVDGPGCLDKILARFS